MKVIIVTQKIDEEDCLLGFFCEWAKKIAKRLEKVYIITLEKETQACLKMFLFILLARKKVIIRCDYFLILI